MPRRAGRAGACAAKPPVPNGASRGSWKRGGGAIGVGLRGGGATSAAGCMFICERRIPARPGGTPGPGNVGSAAATARRRPAGARRRPCRAPPPTPTSVGRRAAGGGVGGRAMRRRRQLDVHAARLGRQRDRHRPRRVQIGRPRLLQDVGRRLVGDRAVFVLEEQVLGGDGLGFFLVEDLGVQLFVVPAHVRLVRRAVLGLRLGLGPFLALALGLERRRLRARAARPALRQPADRRAARDLGRRAPAAPPAGTPRAWRSPPRSPSRRSSSSTPRGPCASRTRRRCRRTPAARRAGRSRSGSDPRRRLRERLEHDALELLAGSAGCTCDGGRISTLRTFSSVEKSLSPTNSRSPVSSS